LKCEASLQRFTSPEAIGQVIRIGRNFLEPFSFIYRLVFGLGFAAIASATRNVRCLEAGMKISTVLALAMFALVPALGLALALMPTPATTRADEQQGQVACMSDAMTVCGQFIPDRERVATCLLSNQDRVSVACREALKRFNPRTASAR
jgi:hypothetical protein